MISKVLFIQLILWLMKYATTFALSKANLMHTTLNSYQQIVKGLQAANATLVAVSKLKSVNTINQVYQWGQRDFGENYVQELVDKQQKLPGDIRWHFIGHLQSNKVKYIAPFIHLIHSVDSFKLLKEINKQGLKSDRVIPVLLQVHIAQEETKFGMDEGELKALFDPSFPELPTLKNIKIKGLMGMASFSDDEQQVRKEFRTLRRIYDAYKKVSTDNCGFEILSMGMSGDYEMALEEGSNMVRIGSLLFGNR